MWQLDRSVVGKKFCSLTVLDDYELIPKKKGTKTKWRVRCDCGNEFYIYRESLFIRKVMFCDSCRPTPKRNTHLYHIYHGMKQRCYNNKNPRFGHYGGKGVRICDEWLASYDEFMRWSLAHGYKEGCGLSIDRINSDGDYCPENCQWITVSENSAKSNHGRQQVSSKLEYIYAISPDGNRIDITNISRFSRDYNLNRSTVSAAIHGRIGNIVDGWELHSPITRQESVTTIENACCSEMTARK